MTERTGLRQHSLRRRNGRIAVAAAATVIVAAAVPLAWDGVTGSSSDPAAAHSQAGPAKTAPQADFDNDGNADLVALSDFADHLAVNYGSDDAGRTGRRQLIGQKVTGTPSKRGDGVGFGEHAVTRDLDGDGYTDLVADVETYGNPKKDGAHSGALVLWGSDDGLDAGSGTYLDDVPGNFSVDQPGKHTLVGGDFDGDGHADLVVQVGDGKGLLKGPFTRDGRAAATAEVPRQSLPQGASLSDTVAGDLNGDGTDDLVSVHEYEDDAAGGGKKSAFLAGSRDGFEKPDTSVLPGLASGAVVGDVDKDGHADLMARRHPEGAAADSNVDGPVEVFYGSDEGPEPDDARHTEIDQDTEGVPGRKADEEQFGDALDAGDWDGDGYADVAVGTPDQSGAENKDGPSAGAVTLLKGGPKGLTGHGAQLLDRPTGGGAQDAEDREATGAEDAGAPGDGDRFGDAVRLLDADGDGRSDLAAGAPGQGGSGAAWVVPSTGGKPTGRGGYSTVPEDYGTIPRHEARDGDFANGFAR
ncbi:FG-GAP and VCBS repeat-containing protein [Streptomyces reniochalinae]|uniref:VCBS repeat-containing protein n=1 Tax=Streptomyces reniochalinae TaxID=2250578 RepID=A0A367EHP6_9ACTN|nr:VCBS repeat-containing protein [Streptomyces reniochalinae]RCG17618.1 VCBS repeat-containing protein [Streptomyces reniochalinae]